SEGTVKNYSTISLIHYFALSSFFIIVTIWLLVIYHFLYREEASRMNDRMRLYGATQLQPITARIIVTLILTLVFATLAYSGSVEWAEFDLFFEEIGRLSLICTLYSGLYLMLLAI